MYTTNKTTFLLERTSSGNWWSGDTDHVTKRRSRYMAYIRSHAKKQRTLHEPIAHLRQTSIKVQAERNVANIKVILIIV